MTRSAVESGKTCEFQNLQVTKRFRLNQLTIDDSSSPADRELCIPIVNRKS
jgi:hypothetical protein